MPDGYSERRFWSGLMDGHDGFVTRAGVTAGVASFKADGSSHWVTRESQIDEMPSLSADGKHLTLMVVATYLKGGSFKQELVYDRMK